MFLLGNQACVLLVRMPVSATGQGKKGELKVYSCYIRDNPAVPLLSVSTGCACMDWNTPWDERSAMCMLLENYFLCCLNIPYILLWPSRPRIARAVTEFRAFSLSSMRFEVRCLQSCGNGSGKRKCFCCASGTCFFFILSLGLIQLY